MIEGEILDPARVIGADLARTIRRALHQATPTLRNQELGRIQDRTPDSTGALRADEMGEADTDTDSAELVHIYTTTNNQLAAYHRVYVQYVEGPAPGLGINGIWNTALWAQGYFGAHMFGDSTTDDVDAIGTWGLSRVEAGIAAIASGRSLRL